MRIPGRHGNVRLAGGLISWPCSFLYRQRSSWHYASSIVLKLSCMQPKLRVPNEIKNIYYIVVCSLWAYAPPIGGKFIYMNYNSDEAIENY